MIAKITGGGNFGGLLAYAERGLRDKGRNGKGDDMHPSYPHDDIGGAVGCASTNPSSTTRDSILLDHNLAGGRRKGETPQFIAQEMDKVRQTRRDIKEPVMHVSIRWEEHDSKRMTTLDLRRYGREFMDRFGVDTSRHQYAMYAHNSAAGDPHLHIIVNRIPIVARERDAIGRSKRTSTVKTWQCDRRGQAVCRAMERAHPRAMTPVVEAKGWPKYFRALTSERKQEGRTGQLCRRREVFTAITRAAKDPRSTDLNSFAAVLRTIDPKLSVSEWRDTATQTVRGFKVIDAATMVSPKKIEKKGKKKKKVEQKDVEKDEQDTPPQPKQWHPQGVHKQLTFGRINEQLAINKVKRQRVAGAGRINGAMRGTGNHFDEQGAVLDRLRRLEEMKKEIEGGVTTHREAELMMEIENIMKREDPRKQAQASRTATRQQQPAADDGKTMQDGRTKGEHGSDYSRSNGRSKREHHHSPGRDR